MQYIALTPREATPSFHSTAFPARQRQATYYENPYSTNNEQLNYYVLLQTIIYLNRYIAAFTMTQHSWFVQR